MREPRVCIMCASFCTRTLRATVNVGEYVDGELVDIRIDVRMGGEAHDINILPKGSDPIVSSVLVRVHTDGWKVFPKRKQSSGPVDAVCVAGLG